MRMIEIVGGNQCDTLWRKFSLLQAICVFLVIPIPFAITIINFYNAQATMSSSQNKGEKGEKANSNMVLDDNDIWDDYTIVTWTMRGEMSYIC